MQDRELMQQALQALEMASLGFNDVIRALSARLAQPEPTGEWVGDKEYWQTAAHPNPKIRIDILSYRRGYEQGKFDAQADAHRPTVEPFCYFHNAEDEDESDFHWPEAINGDCPLCIPLYTAPPQREWQGLTHEEQGQVAWACGAMSADWLEFARAIEAKLKEKNG